MVNNRALVYSYLLTLSACCALSLWRFQYLDKGGKVIAVLISITCLNEWLAFTAARIFHNNMPVYAVFNLIQLLVLGSYFDRIIDSFRTGSTGLKLALLGVGIGIADIIFIQPLSAFNSYFLLLESIAIISFSLFFFARLMLRKDSESILSNPHFWITCVLTFFWSFTFFYWGLRDYMLSTHPDKFEIAFSLLLGVNILTYACMGVIFLIYPPFQRKQ